MACATASPATRAAPTQLIVLLRPAQEEAVISGGLGDDQNSTIHSYEPLAFELPSLWDLVMPPCAPCAPQLE